MNLWVKDDFWILTGLLVLIVVVVFVVVVAIVWLAP